MRTPRLVLFLAATVAFSFPFTIFPSQEVYMHGAAKPFSTAAPGGFVAIRTKTLSMPEDLSSVEIDLVNGDNTYRLPTVEAPKGVLQQVWTVLPEDAAIGSTMIRARLNGVTYYDTFEVVPTAPGLLTLNYEGYGPVIATKPDYARVSLTNAAQPGDEIALYATGLAGAGASDVVVEVAGQPTVVVAAARQPDFRGLDQINFIVPQSTYQGCYVPVQLRVRGIASNVGTLAINEVSGTCKHRFGLSPEDLRTADEGGSVQVARLNVSSSYRNDGMWAWAERATVSFSPANANLLYSLAGPQMPDSLYFGCGVYDDNLTLPDLVDGPDAGASMTFTGPRSRGLTLPGKLYTSTASLLDAPFFTPGAWRLTAPGGTDIAAFNFSLTVPPVPTNLNIRHGQRVPAGQDLTLTWNGAGYATTDVVTVHAGGGTHILNGKETPYPLLTCRTHASDGRITIPWSALEPLDSVPFVQVTVSPHPSARGIAKLNRTDGVPLTLYSDYQFTQSAQLLFE